MPATPGPGVPMRRFARWCGSCAALLVMAAEAAACPLCDTATGERVRAGIAGNELGPNLLLTLLPFPVLFALVALVYVVLPAGTGGAPDTQDSNRLSPGA